MSARRRLNFAGTDAVAADVRRLRGGYTRAGNWSLPQVCWHLGTAMQFSMRPGPYENAPGGLVRRAQFGILLWLGRVPFRVRSPERILPADEVPDEAIDQFLATLEVLKGFDGEFAPHPRFGKLDRAGYQRFHMIHCAHHLGFLSPASP